MAFLRVPRLIAYILTNWMGIIAGAAALNGLVKARHERDKDAAIAVSLAPFPDFTVSININDILTVGGFQAAGELLISLIAFFSAVALLLPRLHHHTENRKGVQPFAIGCWTFALLWTFATAVVTTVFGVNRSAKNNAYVSGVALPPNVVSALQAAAGLDAHYWIHSYTKFLVISAWPLIGLTALSLALTVIAHKRTKHSAAYPSDSTAPGAYGTHTPMAQRTGAQRDVERDGSVDTSSAHGLEKEKKGGEVRLSEEA